MITSYQHVVAAAAWIERRLDRMESDDPSHRDAEAAAAAALAALAAADPPPAAAALAARLGLDRFELQLLLLCAAAEIQPALARRLADADLPGGALPTLGLALALLDDPSWEALAADAPLRRHGLVEVHRAADTPLLAAPIRLDERALGHLLGLDRLDPRLAERVDVVLPAAAPLAPSQAPALTELDRHLDAAPAGGLVQLLGDDPESARALAVAAAHARGLGLLRLAADQLPATDDAAADLALRWTREVALSPRALLVDLRGADPPAPALALLRRLPGHVLVDSDVPRRDLDAPTVEVPPPSAAEQRAAWLAAGLDADAAERLAASHRLGLASIARLARDAGGQGPAAVLRACRRRAASRLGGLAERLEPTARWRDLVLPPVELDLLRRLADQARLRGRVYEAWGFGGRRRGLGISALFAGPSGAGKTLAAEVLAGELDVELLRVELPAIVSKYIGETEKNLQRLFAAAEEGGALLFFDEADALFGRRSEVRDSHDRYANLEVAYLLQRMESFAGLSILATNSEEALDGAFVRRLRFVVRFPFPGPRERAAIWRLAFPPAAPLGEIDHARLAELSLTGGNIHTVAVNAAFMAARAGTPITMDLVLRAAAAELRKLDRPLLDLDLIPGGDR